LAQTRLPGVTRTTLGLLQWWRRDGRDKRLFFAQLEAAETIIFLTEARADFLQGIVIPRDEPSDDRKAEGFSGFVIKAHPLEQPVCQRSALFWPSAISNHWRRGASLPFRFDLDFPLCAFAALRETSNENLAPRRKAAKKAAT
jgi:hypothetical protein